MNSFKIILAALVLFIASNALNGCASQESTPLTMSELGMARIDAAMELKKTSEIMLKEISRKGNEINFQLVLNNPNQQPITSVESWLSFNPDLVKGLDFKPNEEKFNLTAPYANGFDQERGLLKFGRSSTTPLSDASLILADFSLQLISDVPVMIEAYDYQDDLSGHNSANMMKGEKPVNILLKPSSPLYILGASAAPSEKELQR